MGRQAGYQRHVEHGLSGPSSSDNLYSVSSVERRRQARELEHSLKRRQVKYNLSKYKLSRSGRKLKRRLQEGKVQGSEKVSIWHQDIFMVTPRRLKQGAGEHPRSCVCSACLAQYGTYHYYSKALEGRGRGQRRGGRSRAGSGVGTHGNYR